LQPVFSTVRGIEDLFAVTPVRLGRHLQLTEPPQFMGEIRLKPDMEDVHSYSKRYETAIRLLRNSEISERNKELIEKFCNDCFAQNITPGKVQKYAYILRKVAEWMGKDFESATEDHLKRVITMINTSPFTDWTKYDYKRSIKKFFR